MTKLSGGWLTLARVEVDGQNRHPATNRILLARVLYVQRPCRGIGQVRRWPEASEIFSIRVHPNGANERTAASRQSAKISK